MISPTFAVQQEGHPAADFFNGSPKPYVRWWWFDGPFDLEGIQTQLDWVAANGFGGVEIAWLNPEWLGRRAPSGLWLSDEWSRLVLVARQEAAARQLGCDFTFGSCWPFGGAHVTEADASQNFHGPSTERLHGSWENADGLTCRVVDHLSGVALRNYAQPLLKALTGVLATGGAGSRSRPAFFCDSLEISTFDLWSPELWKAFAARFGYRFEEVAGFYESDKAVLYDYRVLIAQTMQREFFGAFASLSREAGAVARVQCHGSPTDLLASYAAVDVPESETLLFPPAFSRIAASAAALSGKALVSAETFTCIYGFSPYRDFSLSLVWKKELAADLKLLADAIFANGVNQIVWHGMPYSTAEHPANFYAQVHVGPDSGFAAEIPALNQYLTDVSGLLRLGRPYTQLAVYLPLEDAWMAGPLPPEQRTPGASHYWELRGVRPPAETEGYHPVWISNHFLREATFEDGKLKAGSATFDALYLDVEWVDAAALESVVRLARQGLPVVLKRTPKQPGRKTHPLYAQWLAELVSLPGVRPELGSFGFPALVEGEGLPFYTARQTDSHLYLFFAHPDAQAIQYPMRRGQALRSDTVNRKVRVRFDSVDITLELVFEPFQSVCLRLSQSGSVECIDVAFESAVVEPA